MSERSHPSVSHLVIVSSNYPAPANPTNGTFVRQFAHAVARQGVRCTVIQPVAFHRAFSDSSYPFYEMQEVTRGAVEVYRPRILSLSVHKSCLSLGPLNPSLFTFAQFTAAVRKVLSQKQIRPDALYGHFLYLAGAAAVQIGSEMVIPAFPCVGEGELWTVRNFGFPHAKKALAPASGFLANSSAIKRTLISELGLSCERIGVFPNSTDLSVFSPGNQLDARRSLGLPLNQFLVAAAGSFDVSKGIVRVGEAIEGLNGVAGVFAGSGSVPPNVSNTAFCRQVAHNEMPRLLTACDIFALPTVIEGSCNAIVEAMACGLPVVSSVGEFNDDLLDDSMSIRVDPLDVTALRHAIVWLRDHPEFRKRMGEAAARRSRKFDANDRARRILDFMGRRIKETTAPA